MDAENFSKLTAILDLLDRYKKTLTLAVTQDGHKIEKINTSYINKSISKRSTRNGIFGFGSAHTGTAAYHTNIYTNVYTYIYPYIYTYMYTYVYTHP